jgi:hypothetical protein
MRWADSVPSLFPCTVQPVAPADNAAIWFAMARRTRWHAHIKPVVLTPDGLGLTPVEAQLLPALGPLALQSLADFSARLPTGCVAGNHPTRDQPRVGLQC